jgi:hypothetical protein
MTAIATWPDCRCTRNDQSAVICDLPCSNRGDTRIAATAVLCDIGGHDTVLETVLRSLGADVDSGELPAGLDIVQIGDLVRLSQCRGAGSDRCVEIADRFMVASPGRWTQLIGNHEVACIGGPTMATWESPALCMTDKTLRTLQRWWDAGAMQVAMVIPFQGQPALVSHAGLTRGRYEALGMPATPADAARVFNEVLGDDPATWGAPGVLVSGTPSLSADCLWADATTELYPSWAGHQVPFNQVHGHSQVFDWHRSHWRPAASDAVKAQSVVDPIRRRVRFGGPGNVLLGIDWTLTSPTSIPGGLPPVLVSYGVGR